MITQNGSRSFIGERVAKVFINEETGMEDIYFGVVKRLDSVIRRSFKGLKSEDTNKIDNYELSFFILYDDGDEEHVAKGELKRMISLYKEQAMIDVMKNESISKKRKPDQVLSTRGSVKKLSKTLNFTSHKKGMNEIREERFLNNLWIMCPLVDQSSSLEKIANLLPRRYKDRAYAIGDFFLFCHERQEIWVRRKQNKNYPWTKDEILHRYHFCNLYRELDRGTTYFHRYIISRRKAIFSKNAYSRTAALDDEREFEYLVQILWAAICYRLVNRVETFEDYGGIPTASEWPSFLSFIEDANRKKNQVLFTGAHNVCGLRRYIETMSKLQENRCKELKIVAEHIHIASSEKDLKGCFNALRWISNINKFFAWQITCDLMESKTIVDFCEIGDWVQLGPGAKCGIKIIFGESEEGTPQGNLLDHCLWLRDQQDEIFQAFNVKFQNVFEPKLGLKELEHALCEFQKYKTAKINDKKRKRLRLYQQRTQVLVEKRNTQCERCKKRMVEKLSTHVMVACDTCGRCFCSSCVGHKSKHIFWICGDCASLSKLR